MKTPRQNAQHQLAAITEFLSPAQFACIHQGINGEEGQFFIDKVAEYSKRISEMPVVGSRTAKNPLFHLHYFFRGCDWYIQEKDIQSEDGQIQAFGLANLGFGAELGYISIQELVENGVELDLHFTPCTRAELNEK